MDGQTLYCRLYVRFFATTEKWIYLNIAELHIRFFIDFRVYFYSFLYRFQSGNFREIGWLLFARRFPKAAKSANYWWIDWFIQEIPFSRSAKHIKRIVKVSRWILAPNKTSTQTLVTPKIIDHKFYLWSAIRCLAERLCPLILRPKKKAFSCKQHKWIPSDFDRGTATRQVNWYENPGDKMYTY